MTEAQTAAALEAHLAAFNAHDTVRLLAGLANDVLWVTGQDVIRGVRSVEELFDDWLWGHDPSLTVDTFVSDDHQVAAELIEELTVDGTRQRFAIAAFFAVREGRITRARIYREGRADLGSHVS